MTDQTQQPPFAIGDRVQNYDAATDTGYYTGNITAIVGPDFYQVTLDDDTNALNHGWQLRAVAQPLSAMTLFRGATSKRAAIPDTPETEREVLLVVLPRDVYDQIVADAGNTSAEDWIARAVQAHAARKGKAAK